MAEFSHSRATYAKKLSNGYVATSKAVYDDVFCGPPKFARPTRVEDYSEIFGSYHSSRGSSIPILDLPVVEDELVDVRSSKFDYKEVFGRFDCVDFAVPYEELFSAEEDRGVGGAVESSSSSEDAWTPAETGSPSEGSCEKPTCLENKKACTNGELPDAYHDVKLFNMSYHKTNQIIKEDGISGTTHIAHLSAVPAYTFVVDEDIPLQSEKFGKSSSQEVNDNQSVNSNGVVEGKEFRKTMSQESASDAPLRNSSGIMEEKNFNKIFSDGPACGTFTKTATSDVKPQSNLCENGTFPRKAFVSVIDINLRTQPTHVPPPERPPPKLTIKQGDSKTSNLKDSTGNAQEGVRGDDSPSFFDVEVDASSSAAASAAAMKVAMEKAQARLKSAKESMERKRDGLQNRKKMGLKEEIKRKERKQGEIVEEIKGDKFHNNIETEEIELNGFDRDRRQREKTRDLNDSQESKGNMYVKGCRSTQHSGEQKRPGEWKAEEQFYELAKKEKCETFGREQNEKTATKVAFEQQEENYVKLQTAARMAQTDEDGKKHKEAHVLQESENKAREAFEREHEKKLKEACELEEYENKLKEACEQQEQEKKLREAREEQEQEKLREAREQQEQENKLREAREQQEQENKLREAREQQEQERKHKEAREQQEQDRKLKEAREQQEQERKLKKSRETVEYEKKLKQAQEREEHEKKLKESREQKENELKQKEARQREENQKRQKEASEREENEKRLKESREFEEYAKKQKEVQELEESKIKQKQVHEENERRLKEQEENETRLKEALQQAKVACEREENEKKLRELQEQKELSEACKKEETEKREKEACEKEENTKRQHKQVWEREDHDELKVSQEFFGCNQGEQNLIALKISRDIAESENKIKADDDTFIQDVDTNSKVTNTASDQEENWKKLNVLQELCENENMMETANYASPGKENKELKVASGQDGRERLTNTCMAQNFLEHKGFENKEEVNHDIKEEKLKEPEEVMEQEKTDKCKKAGQVAFDFEDNKSNHRTVQGEKQQVANGKKMEAAYPVSDLEEKRSKPKMSNELDTKTNTERKEKIFNEKFIREEREKEERLSREREQEKERLRKIEEEKERAREREKDRMAVERATREVRERAYAEARERAERAAVEKATAEVRQRALSEARERLERASAEAREKSLAERASVEARLRAERAAVDRATAEARERAEKAMAEKAAFEARERVERSVSEKFSGTSRDSGMRHSASFSDLRHPTYQSSNSFSGPLRFSNSSNYSASANEKSQASEVESAQRCKARLERHQRTVERSAKALAEKNKRDVQAQREQAERNRLAETLDADVKRWSSGKEGNLRALLSTLQYILGPESGWQPVPLTDVITAVAVKKAYRKATLCVHPDKLQQRGANIQQKYICGKVFDLLKEAWNKFNSEER